MKNLTPKDLTFYVIGLVGAALAGFLLAYLIYLQPTQNNQQPPTPPDETADETTGLPTNETIGQSPMVSGLIEWLDPAEIENLNLLLDKSNDEYVKLNLNDQAKYYQIGEFVSGKYVNASLVRLETFCYDCFGGDVMYLLAVNGDQATVLSKYYDEFQPGYDSLFDREKIKIDADYKIPDLNFPEKMAGPAAGLTFTKESPGFMAPSFTKFSSENLKFVFRSPQVGDVFTTPDRPTENLDIYYESNGFYVGAPDDNLIVYSLDLNNIGTPPVVTWEDGSQNISNYSISDVGGCGPRNLVSLAKDHNIYLADLRVAGAIDNDPVYELKNSDHPLLQEIYDRYYPYDHAKEDFATFVKSHPVFFWTDPFGRLIKFENEAFVPQAECAKPVIYLYASVPTKVRVKINLEGGLTFTEPDYGNGWQVLAQPDGTLTNLADQKTYPYLFWEGRGGLYRTPDKGFVVAQSEVEKFLNDSLAKLGLNQKETADFIEYWLPYFSADAPYYFITFMGTNMVNKLAPLTIDPKPDTLIRVLMDFKPLDTPVKVEGYNLTAIPRQGFTVIEWGGVKH